LRECLQRPSHQPLHIVRARDVRGDRHDGLPGAGAPREIAPDVVQQRFVARADAHARAGSDIGFGNRAAI